ncbi:hypothetical protein T459_05939 [Capsicum annuum]|uniref:Protein kinase domain-containing protein n=1 Tax=Capsicum annuum TaxID=4072 RepID=A0A2G3A998_CAPAN|nr:hypothetical protein T459_05939 [Capsicum annuum]
MTKSPNTIDMIAETGTVGDMAPEALLGLQYDHKCDVYSFGICLWEIYCCSIPYSGQNPHACSAMYESRSLKYQKLAQVLWPIK